MSTAFLPWLLALANPDFTSSGFDTGLPDVENDVACGQAFRCSRAISASIIEAARAQGLNPNEIDTKYVSLGKDGRALAVEPHVTGGRVKLARAALEKRSSYRGNVANHLVLRWFDMRRSLTRMMLRDRARPHVETYIGSVGARPFLGVRFSGPPAGCVIEFRAPLSCLRLDLRHAWRNAGKQRA
jgi:hypothetical protein